MSREGKGSAVIFGAGNVGRGFLGQIFAGADLDVVFVDVDPELVAELNRNGSYEHWTVDNSGRALTSVGPVRALLADDPEVIEALVEADVAATCVGVRSLSAVSAKLVDGIVSREKAGKPPLNVILAENLHDAPNRVRQQMLDSSPSVTGSFLDKNLGLISTSIGRMIPALAGTSSTGIAVEPYRFLPLDQAAVKGSLPAVPDFVMDADLPFDFYTDRKLYIHNMGHSMLAYFGELLGDEYTWQTVGRPDIRGLVRAAMVESADAVSRRWHQPMGPLLDHVDDLLARFGNTALMDTVARVGHDARRKLGSDDRFVGAATTCQETGIQPRFIGLGIAAALASLEKQEGLSPAACWSFLEEKASGLDLSLIREQYGDIGEGFSASSQYAIIDAQFQDARIP